MRELIVDSVLIAAVTLVIIGLIQVALFGL